MKESRDRRKRRFLARKVLFDQRLKDAKTFGLPDDHAVVTALNKEIDKIYLRGNFYSMPWWKYVLKHGRKAIKVTLSELNYILKRK